MEISIGQVVYSRAGRDKGLFFVVVEIPDDKHVVMVDGDVRKLENKKIKNIKHIIVTDTVLCDIIDRLSEEKLTNSYIRKALNSYNDSDVYAG